MEGDKGLILFTWTTQNNNLNFTPPRLDPSYLQPPATEEGGGELNLLEIFCLKYIVWKVEIWSEYEIDWAEQHLYNWQGFCIIQLIILDTNSPHQVFFQTFFDIFWNTRRSALLQQL